MFSNSKNPIVENIYQNINAYNRNCVDNDSIKFIHGSSSAIFAFIGREVTLLENETTVKKVIPNALIPTGLLRKKYGLYPVSGELEIGVFSYGSRKDGINYRFLSGVGPLHLKAAFEYAKYSKRVISEEKMHENILITIKSIKNNLFVRSLKILIMQMTNLMLVSANKKDTAEKANKYLGLIQEKFNFLKKEDIKNDDFDKYLNKYLPRLRDIIENKTPPFVSDEKFTQDIIQQYPIIFCSSVTPLDFTDGVPGEKIHRNELDMNTIKLIFVSDENIEDIKNKLQIAGLQNIQVVGYNQCIKNDDKLKIQLYKI